MCEKSIFKCQLQSLLHIDDNGFLSWKIRIQISWNIFLLELVVAVVHKQKRNGERKRGSEREIERMKKRLFSCVENRVATKEDILFIYDFRHLIISIKMSDFIFDALLLLMLCVVVVVSLATSKFDTLKDAYLLITKQTPKWLNVEWGKQIV